MRGGHPSFWSTGNSNTSQEPTSGRDSQGELKQLAFRASSPPPPANDDSGLIDLRALMAAANKREEAKPTEEPSHERTPLPVVRALPLYPFGDPAESAQEGGSPAPVVPAAPEPRRFAKIGVVLSAVGVAALAAAIGFVMLSGRSPSSHVTGAGGPAAMGPDTVAPAVNEPAKAPGTAVDGQGASEANKESANAVEQPAPAESAEPKAGESAPVKKPVTSVRKTYPATKQPAATAKPAATTTKKAPAADPCKGDLMCAMKRATGQK